MGLLCLPRCESVGAETQFQHVPWRARLAGWPAPSSPRVRSRGGSQPWTPHSFQTSERWSEANGCEMVTAVKFLWVMKATQSSVLDLWTCGVITSSHVAWKIPEVVVVCMWPLVSLVILCINNTKRRPLSVSKLMVYINYGHITSVSLGKCLCVILNM